VVTEDLATALDELLDLDAASLTDGELHDAVVDLGRQTSRLRAAWCQLIREWDVRRVWADNGSKAAGARLARECRMRKAAADHLVHQARELTSMPHTAAAFTAGEITSDHVDLLASASGSGRDAAFATDEAELVEQCKTPWYSNAVRAIDYWKLRVDAETGADEGERVRRRPAAAATAHRHDRHRPVQHAVRTGRRHRRRTRPARPVAVRRRHRAHRLRPTQPPHRSVLQAQLRRRSTSHHRDSRPPLPTRVGL
jgi:hypothetical protein